MGLTLIKWIGITAAVIAVVIAVAIAVMPWGWLKAYAMDRASVAIGRKVTIENIDLVDLSLTPRIRMEKARLENTTWSDRPYMLVIPKLAFSIDLLALLKGRLVLSDVDIEQPKLHLAISRKGKPNWAFLTAQPANGKTAIPIIKHWRINNARATYRNLRSGNSLKGTIGSAEGMIEGAGRHVWLQGNGQLEGKSWRLTSDIGALLDRGRAQQSNKIQVRLKLGNTKAEIDGSVMRPLNFNEFELDFMVKGRDPASLEQLAPVALPHLPRYRFEGRLKRTIDTWSIEDLTGSVGVSDISGDLSLKTGGERIWLHANLASDKIDFVQLFGPAEPGGGDQVIPEATIDVSPLRALDAQVVYQATRVYVPGTTFDEVSAELMLNNGHLIFKPLKFDYLGGTFDSHIEVAANKRPVHTSLQVDLQQLSLNRILAKIGAADQASGTINGHIDLDGHGRSPADFAASADGDVWLTMKKGRIDAMLIEKAGLDIAEMLALASEQKSAQANTRCT
ncbi:MAG: AsmA family protein, partial [Pseudomonadota bacterium]|nr:AsmA family protein [Pseudomonadota bacterium]